MLLLYTRVDLCGLIRIILNKIIAIKLFYAALKKKCCCLFSIFYQLSTYFEETIYNLLIVNHFFAWIYLFRKNNCFQIDLSTDTLSLS